MAWRRSASRLRKRRSRTSITPTQLKRENGWTRSSCFGRKATQMSTPDQDRRGTLPGENMPANSGVVVSVRGSVVDIRFDAHLPPIYSLLHAKDGEIAIEVLAQLDAHRVRGIALNPTQGLVRGIPVEDTGGTLKAPVGKGTLSRMFDVFGNAIDRQAAPEDVEWRTVHRAPPGLVRRSTTSEIFETGIKVIDVLV